MRVKRSQRILFPNQCFLHPPVLRLQSQICLGREETRRRLFTDLYSMLLCFHLQSSNKMKESEHKKSTHEIILNFNKTKKHRTMSAGECSEMAKLTASRDDLVNFSDSAAISIRLHVLRTLDCDAFYISRDFHVH